MTTLAHDSDLFRPEGVGVGRPLSVAPWLGSKGVMAETIVEQLGEHRSYFEPCCGGCSVLLRKPACAHEIVNDLNADLVNLLEVLRDRDGARQVEDELARTTVSELTFTNAKARMLEPGPDRVGSHQVIDERRVRRAIDTFVVWWMGCGGHAGEPVRKARLSVRWSNGGGSAPSRFDSARRCIEFVRERLQTVTVLCRDAHLVVDHIPDEDGVAVYLDWPYIGEGHQYAHDAVDHQRMAAALNRFNRTRIIVSEYDRPETRAMFEGWWMLDCSRTKQLASQGAGAGEIAPEALFLNQPPIGSMAGKGVRP